MITELLDDRRGFASDNCAGVHPKVMEALSKANAGHAESYGDDPITAAAEKAFDSLFRRKTYTYFVMNGTGANCALLAHVMKRYGGVICTDCAHINTSETGAPERIAGVKLIVVPSANGKLTPERIVKAAQSLGCEHYAQPGVVSVTQCTETGTVYTPEEIRKIAACAHSCGMIVTMDGARIATAAASLGVGVSEFTCDAGVDALVFGGTKNAMLYGEAIVFFDEKLADGFKCTRKGCGQLSSKLRYVSAQFLALLKDGLWLETAAHANLMAKRLALGLNGVKGMELVQEPEANMLFVKMDERMAKALLTRYEFHDQDGAWRFVTSYDTTPEDVDEFVAFAKSF